MTFNFEATQNLYNPKARKAALKKALHKVNNPAQLGHIELIQLWVMIGECYKFERDLNASEEAYKKATAVTQEIDDPILHGSVLKHLGDAMYFCNAYQKALLYYKLAVAIFERLKSFPELTELYNQAAYACEKMDDRKQERRFLESAIAIPAIEPIIKANFIERLAISLADSKRYEEAVENYEKALSLYEAENFKRGWQERIQNLANIYHLMGNREAENQTLQRLS